MTVKEKTKRKTDEIVIKKDLRYGIVQFMLQHRKFERFIDIFNVIPRTHVTRAMAKMFGVDQMILLALILKTRKVQLNYKRKSRKKSNNDIDA